MGDVTTATCCGKSGIAALAGRIEKTLGIQLAFQCIKGRAQRAFTGGFHVFNDYLELAPALVEADATAQQNLLPVGWLHARSAVGVCEHGAAHLSIAIFKSEVPVARTGPGKT